MRHISKVRASAKNNKIIINWENDIGVKGQLELSTDKLGNPDYVSKETAREILNAFLDEIWNTAESFDYDPKELVDGK